jgi:hypothetical protein
MPVFTASCGRTRMTSIRGLVLCLHAPTIAAGYITAAADAIMACPSEQARWPDLERPSGAALSEPELPRRRLRKRLRQRDHSRVIGFLNKRLFRAAR